MSAQVNTTHESLLAKLDKLEASMTQAVARAKRRGFWLGWLWGTLWTIGGFAIERVWLG